MAPSLCLRCLSRSLPSSDLLPLRHLSHPALFSTSAPLLRTPPKKSNKVVAQKGGANLRLKKTVRASAGKRPDPGERKAFRKKITLSNGNALEVAGLQDLGAEHLSMDGDKPRLAASQGSVLGLSQETVEALKSLESFKPYQRWNLFKRPATLIRSETVELAKDMIKTDGSRNTTRQVIFGEQGSGKSVLLLQAHAMALAMEWIVIHVPEANDVTNAQTSYEPIQTEQGVQYIQPHYLARVLGNLAKANARVLQGMTLSQQHTLPIPVQSNISLSRLAELGARDPDLAWPIWRALWSELTAKSKQENGLHRRPVLLTVDGADHIMRQSAYFDAAAKPIHAFDLALISHFAGILAGREHLSNGGMALAAVSEGNRAATPTFDHYLDLEHARRQIEISSSDQGIEAVSSSNHGASPLTPPTTPVKAQPGSASTTLPTWDPYVAKDRHVQAMMENITGVVKLEGLSKQEARGIMEYYAQSGIMRGSVTDATIGEKWSLAGRGIIGQIERSSVSLAL